MWNLQRKMLLPIHLMPPPTCIYGSARTPALVSAAGLRGARNVCSDEWPTYTTYCPQIGTIMLDNEQEFVPPVTVPTQPTRPSQLECADPTAVRDASILLWTCWFCMFWQLAILSERDSD